MYECSHLKFIHNYISLDMVECLFNIRAHDIHPNQGLLEAGHGLADVVDQLVAGVDLLAEDDVEAGVSLLPQGLGYLRQVEAGGKDADQVVHPLDDQPSV